MTDHDHRGRWWSPDGPVPFLRCGRPTVRGAGVTLTWVVVVVAVLVTGQRTLWPLAVGLGVPILAAPVISYRRLRRLPPGRHVHLRVDPPMVPQGAACRLQVTVAGGPVPLPPVDLESPVGRWTTLGELPVDLERSVSGRDATGPVPRWAPAGPSLVHFRSVAPGGAGAAAFPVATGRRGILGLPRLRLWTGDPFGLFGCAGPLQNPCVVVVHPRPVPSHLPGLTAVVAPGTDGSTPGRPPGGRGDDLGDLAGLRPYRVGDRLHRAHWPSMAGTGPVMVREFDPDSDRIVQVVIDDRPGTHRRQAFDRALSVTYGLISEATAGGVAVDMLTLSGHRTRVVPTPEGAAALLPLLATLTPSRDGDAGPPPGGWERWGDEWQFAGCTVVTTETAAPSLPTAITGAGRIVTL